MKFGGIAASFLCASVLCTTPTLASPKVIERYKVEIDGRPYRVLRLDNGRVKVVEGGVFGTGATIDTRDRMRRAVIAVMGCTISDEYWSDGKLVGDLVCPKETKITSAESMEA